MKRATTTERFPELICDHAPLAGEGWSAGTGLAHSNGIALIAALALLLASAAARAQTEPEMPAECDGNTGEIVECVMRQAKVWDRRLNEAYQKKMQSVQGSQRDQLRTAQRLWVQYRDANCHYYALGEGTISRVEAAECMRSMTESRTLELEETRGN